MNDVCIVLWTFALVAGFILGFGMGRDSGVTKARVAETSDTDPRTER
jgi:hypothetical protein